MIVGEHNRPSDLDVNWTREKKLTNIRPQEKDENVVLTRHNELTIETVLDWIDEDQPSK